MIKCILKAVWIITFFFSVGINSHFCKYHVCLTWTVSDQVLNLSCRVSNLHFRVKIQDPSGKLMGECVPGQKKSSCDEYAKNVVIAQNIKTNETTCMIRGIIDNSLNGKWKCLHGTNTGLAEVEVTVLRNKEQHEVSNIT
ncbi:uncharacterized protein LOC134684683 [Mytilus trossulus]|uniref:uncharacterized protein LOC134684683 n=1 Tax=Mytilus trossulus TaxID=6551 RepID=UPI0030055CAB